jgi:hypothetical protein
MSRRGVFLLLPLTVGVALIASCKPINLFSPLVDPSKMGNDAKIDAGYNAIADGDYEEAIDYFSDVIDGASGEDLTDAYIGRATSYMNIGAPGLDEAVSDLISGDIDFDDTGQVITDIKGDNDYDEFFDNVSNAADDYNAAIDNAGQDMDKGILVEAYQANLMAATGVGATRVSVAYNVSPWNTPLINDEIDAILAGDGSHPFDMATWDINDKGSPSSNGLYEYVRPSAADRNDMLGYLQSAFDALTALESDPPLDMGIPGLKSNINSWVTNGLDEAPLT